MSTRTPSSAVNPVAAWLERGFRWLLYAAGWWLMLIVVLTCVEILGRKLFGFSLQGVDEIGGYTLSVTASLALSWALVQRGHTRVDFLLARFSPGVQAICNVAAVTTLALIASYAAYRGVTVLSESIEFKSRSTTPLQTPLWIPQSGWLIGWMIFAATSVTFAVHAWILLIRDRVRLNRFYGPITVEEEIEAELGRALADPDGPPRLAETDVRPPDSGEQKRA